MDEPVESTVPGPRWREGMWLVHQALLVASLAFFGWLLFNADWRVLRPGLPLWSSAILYVGAATIRPLMWASLLDALHGGAGSSSTHRRLATWRDASRARTTRYLPGRIFNWTARFVVAKRSGYSSSVTAESIAIDTLLPPLILLWVAVAAAASELLSVAAGITILFVGFVVTAWAMTTGRNLARRALHGHIVGHGNPLLTRIRPALAGDANLPASALLPVLLLYFLWGISRTVAFVILTLSTTNLAGADAGLIAVAGAVGGLAGQLVIVAPMGLGVREGVAGALLRSQLSVSDAATAVTATRVIQTVAELPAFAITEVICFSAGAPRVSTVASLE